MGRFGKKEILIPEGVKVSFDKGSLTVEGPRGVLARTCPVEIDIQVEDGCVRVKTRREDRFSRSLQGTFRSHINNMIIGVTQGWRKVLEFNGPGFRAEVKGNELILNMGYSHPVVVSCPENTTFKVEKNEIVVEGLDKEVVGQVAAEIRRVRPPDPYKGMGIKYKDEVLITKPGKQTAKA